MRKYWMLLSLLLLNHVAASQEHKQVDPNLSQDGGYGYLIRTDSTCTVWWAEGAYKVMRAAPLPVKRADTIRLWSARNEFESFILVLKPKLSLDQVRIDLFELSDGRGHSIASAQFSLRKVAYVHVTRPTDAYGFAGWWPDPLPLYEQPEPIAPGENQPFWITVKVPAEAHAGDYRGHLRLSAGAWSLTIPIKLQVWDFLLPKTPSMRSGFGLSMAMVKEYDNLNSAVVERQVFDYYMESFRDYKISPYNPFEYAPIREEITGVAWQGGLFDSREKHTGRYAYKLVDASATANIEGQSKALIPIQNADLYRLCWFAKSATTEQPYVVGVECYNAAKELLVFENRFEIYTGQPEWQADTLDLGILAPEIRFIKVRLFPTNRTVAGADTGTVWFDDLGLINTASGQNEFTAGDFEVDVDQIDIAMDFTDFNQAGKRYFDAFGFNGYLLALKGLGGGTYYSRTQGEFAGFEQGTAEYEKLMARYLALMQNNLEHNGWLGKEYIYWFDEPGEKDYPFVRETHALIKNYAPKLTTFLTEHVAGQDISDVTDISCTIWHKLDHDKIRRMNQSGLEHWSYLCCWPKSPWLSEFIDHDAVNLRLWLWASYQYQLKGILIWQTTYWNSPAASPEGYLQNPWAEAMSFVSGYGCPLGKQTIWGNGDGRFFYPLNRDPNHDSTTHVGRPVPSLRLELLRDGIEDYEYFVLLEKLVKNSRKQNSKDVNEARALLAIPKEIYTNETTYNKNPRKLLEYRKKLAEYIVKLGQ